MKYVKMLGLAAVAAAALMAFVGASSASATVLCKTTGTGSPTGTTCAPGWAYEAGTDIHAVNQGTVTLDGELFNIECSTSTLTAHTLNEGSATETVKAEVTALTFTNCGPSTVTVLEKGTLEIHWIEGTHNGTLTGGGQRVTTVTNTIFGAVHCEFTIPHGQSLGDVTDSVGAAGAIFHSSAKITALPTSGLCPEEGAWTATYELTTPKPLSIAGHT